MAKNLLILLLVILMGGAAQATTYYVSSTGNDAQAGTSRATAWRTVARAGAHHYGPGDRLLFEGGQTFSGGLWLRGSQGTPTQPIIISSYGPGRATITSGSSFGFYAQNTAGIELRRLAFVGAGRLSSSSSGVVFYLDSVRTSLRYLRFDSLDVSGYRDSGIAVGSWQGPSGFTDVRFTNCQTHANGQTGISSYGQDLAAHHNWYVGHCQAYDNSGRADVTNSNTGSGIMLSGIDGALIEQCEAYNNGWLNANPGGGPVGIWGYACNNLVIQNCVAHHNRSGIAHDGGGFDLDGGCTNSVLQYNYSHDNDGPGYLLAQYAGAAPMHDLTIRYNVSENDARRYDQGALAVWSSGASGGIQRADIYNNTVLLSPTTNGSRPKAFLASSAGISGISVRNNVLQTSGGVAVLSTVSTAGLRLEGNCYWSGDAALTLSWAGTVYTTLAAWRAATGQERLSDGRATGLQTNPQLPATLGAPATYMPAPDSPVRGAGLDLKTEFNIIPGPRDFVGSPTPLAPAHGNIGALEAQQQVAAPLPVVLSGFSVQRQSTAAVLSWSTAAETNNAYFAIESSADGRTFAPLAQVAGHGTTALSHAYTYADLDLARYASSAVYYRLRQVDTNGQSTYSPVRVLTMAAAALATQGAANQPPPTRLQVAPNPALTAHTVLVQGARSTDAQLLTVQGQLVVRVRVGADGTAGLPVAGLAAGVYIVRCGTQSTRLLVVN